MKRPAPCEKVAGGARTSGNGARETDDTGPMERIIYSRGSFAVPRPYWPAAESVRSIDTRVNERSRVPPDENVADSLTRRAVSGVRDRFSGSSTLAGTNFGDF